MWQRIEDNHGIRYERKVGGPLDEKFTVAVIDEQVNCVCMEWTPEGMTSREFNQYFFRDNQPGGFRSVSISWPDWPTNRPPLSDDDSAYFRELGNKEPTLKESLDVCIAHLEKPGRIYERE
jgi:hypothetical protein